MFVELRELIAAILESSLRSFPRTCRSVAPISNNREPIHAGKRAPSRRSAGQLFQKRHPERADRLAPRLPNLLRSHITPPRARTSENSSDFGFVCVTVVRCAAGCDTMDEFASRSWRIEGINTLAERHGHAGKWTLVMKYRTSGTHMGKYASKPFRSSDSRYDRLFDSKEEALLPENVQPFRNFVQVRCACVSCPRPCIA